MLPVAAFYTGLNSRLTFNALCLFFLLAGYLLYAKLSSRRWGAMASLVFAAVIAASPLSTVILSWLGTPDSLTFLLTVPFLFINSASLVFALVTIGTMNHITFVIAAGEILTLRILCRDGVRVYHLLVAVLGGAIGYALVKMFLVANHIDITVSRLGFILTKSLDFWVTVSSANLPVTLFLLFNVQWFVFAASLLMFSRVDRVYYLSVFCILLLNYGITFFTLDTTRVFSLLSWGILAHTMAHSYTLAQRNGMQQRYLSVLAVIGMLSLLAPRLFTWEGGIHAAPHYEWLISRVIAVAPWSSQ